MRPWLGVRFFKPSLGMVHIAKHCRVVALLYAAVALAVFLMIHADAEVAEHRPGRGASLDASWARVLAAIMLGCVWVAKLATIALHQDWTP